MVAAWNWWPAKRYVLADLKQIARRENTTLFADWTAALRNAWHLQPHQSVLILSSANGTVLFASSGPLDAAQLAALVAHLKSLGCDTD